MTLHNGKAPAYRTERDTFGPIDVPARRLWGAQTQRSLQHFAISGERMAPELIRALAQVKRASAYVNHSLGLLDATRTTAIVAACDEVMAGAHEEEFPLVVWQTGSGTQTNMNMNEVLANRASELLGGPRGEGRLVHPNDDVNKSQSSNDVFPTAMHLAAVDALTHKLLPALHALRMTLAAKAEAFADIVKIGRTHLQDATPLTLGQEVSGWVAQLDHAERHVRAAMPHLCELALGGTAVGTGFVAASTFQQWRRRHPGWRVLERGERFGARDVPMIEVPELEVGGLTAGPVWFALRPDPAIQGWMSSMMARPIQAALGGSALRHFRWVLDYPAGMAHAARVPV